MVPDWELSLLSDSKCELKGLVPWDDGLTRPRRRPRNAHAKEANRSIDAIDNAARLDGYKPPSLETKKAARRIVNRLSREFDRHFEILPTDHREISIEIVGGYRRGVMVLVKPDGSASCFLTIDGENEGRPYKSADELPDDFLIGAVRRILS